MKKKTHLYFITGIAVLILISIVTADVPPPPANQDIGIYDTVFTDFTEEKCRVCHSSGLPDRHHMLVFEGEYGCMDCHSPDYGNGNTVTVIRDCLNSSCHTSTPHHGTEAAQAQHCSVCHGSFVDDFDDGHFIPTYNVSNVTPATDYRIINETGKKWGGCEACHEPDYDTNPVIESNKNTHHRAMWINETTCLGLLCHFDPIANIRKCEDCHGVRSLHNIQYDYDNTTGQLGYGHVGDNWDCLGCHAWYEPTKSSTGPEENVIPDINNLSKGSIEAGISTQIDIEGNNFVNTINGTTNSSKVVLANSEDGTIITLDPYVISPSNIKVWIPSLDAGIYSIQLVKDGMKSKRKPFVVEPKVTIKSAFIGGDVIYIIGSGFNEELEEGFDGWLGVDIEHNGEVIDCGILSWSDTMIKLDCEDANIGDKVNVKALFGSESSELIAGLDGDANCDTLINAGDYGLLKGYVLGAPVSINTWGADVNCDTLINAGDYGLLKGYVLGAPVTLNCCGK